MYQGRLFLLMGLKELYNFPLFKEKSIDITISEFEKYYINEFIDYNTRILGSEWNLLEREDCKSIFKYIKWEYEKIYKYYNTIDMIEKFETLISQTTNLKGVFEYLDYKNV